MARLETHGSETTDLGEIAGQLARLGVALRRWPVSADAAALLAKPSLSDEEKEQVLQAHDTYFNQLRDSDGYQTRDLIVLHPGIPGLDTILAKFDRIHTHDDDEVRYIVEGEGIFGFVFEDGSQARLTIESGEYINVPADTEHWFEVTDSRRIKAVRYFTTTEGWTPRYTDTAIRV
ncbi:MAG: 1,2-dihydroxy-3-keto-5-methylthiopentene dioxygenase [Myxococcota bacterium]|jgi:1,2-dihydroxy-3-keto-5-methylthiopentene dioxygenase